MFQMLFLLRSVSLFFFFLASNFSIFSFLPLYPSNCLPVPSSASLLISLSLGSCTHYFPHSYSSLSHLLIPTFLFSLSLSSLFPLFFLVSFLLFAPFSSPVHLPSAVIPHGHNLSSGKLFALPLPSQDIPFAFASLAPSPHGLRSKPPSS